MKKEEKRGNAKKIILIIILVIAGIILYGRYVNTKGLKVKEYAIINETLPENFHGLKIVHFSDILYGQTTTINDIAKMIKKINELKPDIVVFTGDLFNKNITANDSEIKLLTEELSKIKTNLYKYAIAGDSDSSNYNNYQSIMTNSGFIILNNSNELLYYKGNTPIKIVGLTNTEDLESSYKEEALEPSFTIALMHEPDQIEKISEYRTDIAFAGHALGGVINIPFIGGIIKNDGANKYITDHHLVNNTDFYVSSGIGTDNIKFRIFNKPSINLYRLYNK